MNIAKQLYHFIHTNKKFIAAFLTVGALSAVVNFCSFSFFWKVLGLPYQYAVSIAYVLSVIFHFTGNRNVTFKSRESNLALQVLKYLTMVFTNYLITLTIVHFVVEKLHFSPYIGIIASISTTVWTGYLMSRLWVFRNVSTEY
jgi:putative flippase GtrA